MDIESINNLRSVAHFLIELANSEESKIGSGLQAVTPIKFPKVYPIVAIRCQKCGDIMEFSVDEYDALTEEDQIQCVCNYRSNKSNFHRI